MPDWLMRVKGSTEPLIDLTKILERLHEFGPADSEILEKLSAYKEFHPVEFALIEEKIISAMGLFYKVRDPKTLYSFILSGIEDQYVKEYGKSLTPVQASVRRAVEDNQFVSISAPTSAGKSYSIRDFIAEQEGNAVVVVPSRALIAEYLGAIKRRFGHNKQVMVSAFVDNVYRKRTLRHIFVLTPERARELFAIKAEVDISVFFFDEAQVSEETGRGIVFDVLVRRIRRSFPTAKLIFAHPFVDNPEAQFQKHGIDDARSFAKAYTFGAVGKLSVFKHKTRGADFYFSPFSKGGHKLTNCVEFPGNFKDFAFSEGHSVLIYVSKGSIYKGSFLKPFQSHIRQLPSVTHPAALAIIDAIRQLLGADDKHHRSSMVSLLRKGVVIHHGSVPLEVRFLIEDFVRGGFARVCFATSTLAQGINMPFDIVWLENNRMVGEGDDDKALAFKNLIGRAGRLSDALRFDYGYVYTCNPRLYAKRLNERFELDPASVIDSLGDDMPQDSVEIVDSIRNGTFNDEYNLPETKISRLSTEPVSTCCRTVLNLLYSAQTIGEVVLGTRNESNRRTLISAFQEIFQASIGRKLYDGEQAVFDQAVRIFLLSIGGKTFKEIVGMRYSYIANRDGNGAGNAKFSQKAEKLPNSSLINSYPFISNTLARNVSYDAIVFDTYDYMDQVISFSMTDVIAAAFKIYGHSNEDSRAGKMLDLLRFGTNDSISMLLMRYGFEPDIISEIRPYVHTINENEITFVPEVARAPKRLREKLEWYLP